MWKIKIEYSDKSKVTLTGQQKEISLRLARMYHIRYVAGRRCKAVYQQYPKNKYPEVDLFQKIEEMEEVSK